MAKFVEVPQKPRTVHAIMFTGIENDAPTFNEQVPSWIVGPMVRGRLSIGDGMLMLDDASVPVHSWLMVDEGDAAGHSIRFAPAAQFFDAFRLARKKPGPRSKLKLNVAAE